MKPPIQVKLRNFRSHKYWLVQDLNVVLEETPEGQHVAYCADLNQYGHGFSPDHAIRHLCQVIEDYYELLKSEKALGPAIQYHLQFLKEILVTREKTEYPRFTGSTCYP